MVGLIENLKKDIGLAYFFSGCNQSNLSTLKVMQR